MARFARHASENGLPLAGYARHASEMPRKSPSEDTPREDLVGRGDAAKGVRGVVGCRALAAKLASVKLRLQVSDADNLAES